MPNTRNECHPFEAFMRLPEDIFREFMPRGPQPREHASSRVWSPPVDIYEDREAIIVRAELPGMKQEEIDIELNGDSLTIKGERKFGDEAQRENYIRVERQYGAFQRSFTIGAPIQEGAVKATYRNGILEVVLPKSEAVRPKKVQVVVE